MIRELSFIDVLYMIAAARWTLALTAIAFLGGGIVGLLIALLRVSSFGPLRWVGTVYVVVVQGTDRVVIELPGVTDVDSVRRLVGQTGQVDFVPLGTTPATQGQVLDLEVTPPLFGGDQVVNPAVGQDQNGGLAVNFTLRNEAPENAGQKFSRWQVANRSISSATSSRPWLAVSSSST